MPGFFYRAFGQTLNAEVALPWLSKGDVTPTPDITIHSSQHPGLATFQKQPWLRSSSLTSSGQPSYTAWRLLGDGGYHLQFGDGFEFTVDGSGSHIWSAELSGEKLPSAAAYLLSLVLGTALYLQGLTCLHASAVVVDDQAVLFVGDAGAGKSSLAAFFALNGFPVLSDDIVALLPEGEGFVVPPAVPVVRLRSQFVDSVFGTDHQLPLIAPDWDKVGLRLGSEQSPFPAHPVPPALIYLLSDPPAANGTGPFTQLSPRDALLYLSNFGYLSYFMDKAMHRTEFAVFAALVETVSVRFLSPIGDPRELETLVPQILADVRGTRPPLRPAAKESQAAAWER